eukprot:PRCOL_00005567-RA
MACTGLSMGCSARAAPSRARVAGPRRNVSMMATSRATKESQVEEVKALLEDSFLVGAIPYSGTDVATITSLRVSLPEEAKLKVVKNTLMKRAIDGDEKWSSLEPLCTGMNAWMFIQGEEVPPTMKALKTFRKENDYEPNWSGGALDGSFVPAEEFAALEKLPTKKELYAKIAGLVKQVPTKVARAVNAVPSKVAYGVVAAKDKAEEEGRDTLA